MIRLVLRYPISANRYWRPVRIGQHITIVPTKEAKAYRAEVAAMARQAGIREPLKGRLTLDLKLYPHRPLDYAKRMRLLGDLWDDSVQCIDLGNADKVLSDALNGVAIADDKQFWRITMDRCEPDGVARVVVTIDELPPRTRVEQKALDLVVPRETAPDPFAECQA